MSKKLLLVLGSLLTAAVPACVSFEDRCLGVSCKDGEICVDLQGGPTCVCDDLHVEENGVCVPVEGDEEPAGDAGP